MGCVRECICVCVVGDVPKLEFGEEGKREKGEKATFFLGGGGAGNKQRTCTRARGCRSFKEGCHALAAPEP